MAADGRLVGQTRDVGFQIGVRRTLAVPLQTAWRLLTSPEGARVWLGEPPPAAFTPATSYRLEDGAHGEVRVCKENSHLRLTWRPAGWPRPSTIQVRVVPSGEKTVISFHQEHLPGPAEREERREFFALALETLRRMLL